ncbi:Matrix metalloproteinase [Trichuris trichiura]|uniref:Matrix metalloproteinase n=1 Tax=Trichuris trichiura TaxID=36087 RepID=A0A077Z8N7_TRITR|nr:Matrix metalloproteinase [Trichuris trichiura]
MKVFQEMAGIPSTGDLNASTIGKMRQRRCGIADVQFKKKRFSKLSKWLGKMSSHDVLRLKWKIAKYSQKLHPEATRLVVRSAFKIWSDQIAIPSMRTAKLEFSESSSADDSDIDILFATGEHGDQYPFDGGKQPGNSSNILAHTFYPNYQPYDPLNGDIHFDDSENWTLDPYRSSGNPYFPYVLVHEIGHALGLGHSKRQEAVMNPIYKSTPLSTVTLDIDDKCALNWNYIGPSNICLFVWLMVELLPRARNSTVVNLHGHLSSYQNAKQKSTKQLMDLFTDHDVLTQLDDDAMKENAAALNQLINALILKRLE